MVDAIKSLIGLFTSAYDGAVKLGGAIANMWSGGGAGATPNAPKSPYVSNSIAGARALGSPVTYGKPYLVGERGPELFVRGQTGRIETNDTLRRLTADGAVAVAGSSSTSSTRTYTLNPTFHIAGENPREVAVKCEPRWSDTCVIWRPSSADC